MEDIKLEIQKLLAKGKTSKALDILTDVLSKQNPKFYEELIVIKAENTKTNNLIRTNQISDERAQIRLNRTHAAIISLLSKLEKKENIIKGINKQPEKKKFNLAIGIIMLLLVIIALIYYDQFTENEEDLSNIEAVEIDKNERIGDLVVEELGIEIYPNYRDVYLHNIKTKTFEVRQKTKALINQLELIKDEDLEIHSKIYKYIGLTISNKILTLTASVSDSTERIKYSSKSIISALKAEQLIDEIAYLGDEEYKAQLREWVDTEKHENRILVNKFISMAANYRAKGVVSKEEVITCFRKLAEDAIITEEGYNIYPIINWLQVNQIIKLKNKNE